MNIGNASEQVGSYLQNILNKNFWTVADIHRATSAATDFEKIPTEKAMRNLLSGRTKKPTSKVLQAFAVGISKLSKESKWTADFILSEAALTSKKSANFHTILPIGFPNFQKSFEGLGKIGRYLTEDVNPWYSWTEHSASFSPPSNSLYEFSEESITKSVAESATYLMFTGESGTGKTRFMYEISKRLEIDGWLVVEMAQHASESDFADLVEVEEDSYEGVVILIDGIEQFALDTTQNRLLRRIFQKIMKLNNEGCQFRVISTCRSKYIESSFCDQALLNNFLIINVSPDAGSLEFDWMKKWRKIAKERIQKSEKKILLVTQVYRSRCWQRYLRAILGKKILERLETGWNQGFWGRGFKTQGLLKLCRKRVPSTAWPY